MRFQLAIIAAGALILGSGIVTANVSPELPLLWEEPVKVEGMFASRISAVWYQDRIHIVHGGKNGDAIWHASWDNKQWMINRVSNLTGEGTPTLAVFQNKLHIVYKEKNNTLWHATSEGRNWTSRGQIPGQKSHYSPGIVPYPYNRVTGRPGEYLWLWHSGGSLETKRDLGFSLFDGSAWSNDEKMMGPSEGTVSLCMYKDRLYRVMVYASGIIMTHYVKNVGWAPVATAPRNVHTTTPVSLVSDGENLYMFYRQGKSEPGSEAPIYATVTDGNKWIDPVPVKDFTSIDSPALLAVPGQKGRFYLLFTNHNKEIFITRTIELKNQLKPLKQMVK